MGRSYSDERVRVRVRVSSTVPSVCGERKRKEWSVDKGEKIYSYCEKGRGRCTRKLAFWNRDFKCGARGEKRRK